MHDETIPENQIVASPDHAAHKHPPVSSIEDVIVFKLARFVAINERLGARWSEALFDLSINEWRLLALVQGHGAIRAGDLAQIMLMDKSQLSRLIRRLTARELVISKTDKEDARAVALSITDKGLTLYQEMMAEVMRRNERVIAALETEEVAQFNTLLDRLITHNLGLLEARQNEEG